MVVLCQSASFLSSLLMLQASLKADYVLLPCSTLAHLFDCLKHPTAHDLLDQPTEAADFIYLTMKSDYLTTRHKTV